MVGKRKSQRVLTRQGIVDLIEDARRRGVELELPGEDLHGLDLSTARPRDPGRRLTSGRGFDFIGADLQDANLMGANLRNADLTGANLTGANLMGANLTGANLMGANLRNAYLTDANLRNAHLMGADLTGANLLATTFRSANLTGADLSRCTLGFGTFADIDLSGIRNLASVLHHAPTEIGTNTLEQTAARLATQPGSQRNEVFDFLRKAGVPDDLLTLVRSWIENPIEFYSCFISYSHADREFARLLYDTLQGRGIRCWLDEHQLLPGDNIYDMVDRGIRLWDKVLICCSQAALTSWWVDDELDNAFEKERRLQKERGMKIELVIPLDLDGFLFSWGGGKAAKLRERFAPGFARWETSTRLFGEQADTVIKALRSDAGAREVPPKPKL